MRQGRDRVCHSRVQKQTAESSVFFGDNNMCQNNLIIIIFLISSLVTLKDTLTAKIREFGPEHPT